MGETQVLAGFLSALRFEDLPEDVVAIAKLCILDAIGVGLTASTRPWVRAVAEEVAESGSRDVSTIWGQAHGGSAEEAALVNGTSVHGIEMDDRAPRGRVHPGCYAIPPAIALGERAGGTGKDAILSVVVGYELGIRVGLAVRFTPGFFAQTAHKGVWSSVGASSKALKLSAEQTVNAYGLAGSMASGMQEFSRDPHGTMVKRLHGGLGARSGILAAGLASRGMTAPRSILEGEFGYLAVLSAAGEPSRIEELTTGLGGTFKILEREVKPYAAWGGGHLAIDAVRAVRMQQEMEVDDIVAVRVGGSRALLAAHDLRRPASMMAAQYSLPFLTAVALARGPDALVNPNAIWIESTLNDEVLKRLEDRVEVGVDPDLDELANAGRHYGGARITVRLSDGKTHEAVIHHSKGTMENPMTSEEIHAKFERLVADVLAPDQALRIRETVETLDSLPDLRELGRILRTPIKSH